MDFNSEIILENDRALLRPLKPSDYDILLEFSINEPTLWQYSLIPANGPENLKAYMDKAFTDRDNKISYPFIVFDKESEGYAGSTRFYDFQAGHNTTQLGYTWYGKKFWGTGLNKNCKYLMLEYAFETLDLFRVEFRADNNNERSIAAMKSLGCKVEGVLRQNCAAGDARRDSIILSILQSEWYDVVKANLLKRI